MKISHNVPLSDYTSLRAGGPAEVLIEIEAGDDLRQVIADHNSGPLWLLGHGTNCLISDKGLPGTVILNRVGDLEQLTPTRFKVGSGYDWDQFIQVLIREGLWGLEFTSGIPGGTGAAITGNIAAYGHKVDDSFVEATILYSQSGQVETWAKAKLGFAYRSSNLQKPDNSHLVVVDATFELRNKPTGELEYESALKVGRELGIAADSLTNRRRIILETRRRAGSLLTSRDAGPWTAGSFFKNPIVTDEQAEKIVEHEEVPKTKEQIFRQNLIHGQAKDRVSGAHVLLAAGFYRGQTWGHVRLSPQHILKIENLGHATAQEIYNVVQDIISTVDQKLGVKLEPEVRYLGQF